MNPLHEQIVVRNLDISDKELVREFFLQMSGETRALFNRNEENHNRVMRFFNGTSKDCVYFLAMHQNLMVGYLYLMEMNRSVPWLGVAVREDYKGKGIGWILVRHAIHCVREQGKGGILLSTHVTNLRGESLYEKSGFERLGVHHTGETLYLFRF